MTSLSSLDSSHTDPYQHIISDLVNFYSRSDLHPKQVKFTKNSFAQSIQRSPIHTTPTVSSNPYQLLSDLIDTDETMEIDSPTNHTPSIPPQKVSWSTDLGVSTLSEELFSHMSKQKIIAEETGELDDFPYYKKPQARIDSSEKINQRIRFNLIRHKGTVSDIPVSKLFKSFASTLKKADPSLVFHPFQALTNNTILHSSLPNKSTPLMTTKSISFSSPTTKNNYFP
jgi:hypothetical protein